MATTTFNRLIEMMARATGYYFAGTATGGTTTTIVDTSTDGFDARSDKRTTGKWARIVTDAGSAAPEEEARKVSAVATTTATVDTAFSAAVAVSDTYELTAHHPQDLKDSIQQAIRQTWPVIYVPLIDETLMVDNLLTNWDFETAGDGTPVIADWAEVGSPTVTQDTTRVKHGTYSAKVVAGGADGLLEQNLFDSVEVTDLVGLTLIVRGSVWASAASVATIEVTFDGSAYSASTAHGGGSEWQGPTEMYLSVAVPSGATEMTVTLRTVAGATVYWDVMSAYIRGISKYTIPATFINGVHRVSIQADRSEPNEYYYTLTESSSVSPGQIIRLEGKGALSVPTTGTGTTEISEIQAEFIVANAARILYARLKNSDTTNRDDHEVDRAYWASEADRLSRVKGVRSPRMAADKPLQGAKRFQSDSSGSYLSLPR